jgi:hypothetical protein
MEISSWERHAAWGGLAFVAVAVVIAALGGEPPAGGANSAEIVRYYADERVAIEAGLWLFGLGVVPLIWWLGSLWRRMVRAEHGTAGLAVVSMIGVTLAGALSFASAAVWATAALQFDAIGDDVAMLHSVGAVLSAASGYGLATHLLAANALGARTRTLPSWVVGVGTVSAVAWLAAAVTGAQSGSSVPGVLGFVAFALWCLWILGVSRRMWVDAGSRALATVA